MTAAGIMLALSVEAFLFQFSLLAWSLGQGNAGVGAYVGLVAGGVLLAGAVLTFRALLRLTSEAAGADLGT